MRRTVAVVSLAALLAPSVALAGHDLHGRVTQDGLDFVAAQVPSYVPAHISAPEISKEVACVEAFQRNTEIDLHVDGFSLQIPEPGRIRLDITVSASGRGQLEAQDVIACLGDMTCTDDFTINGARAIVDFGVTVEGGTPHVVVASVDTAIDGDNFSLVFSDCFGGDLISWVIDFARDYISDYLVRSAANLAATKVATTLEQLMGGYSGVVGSTVFTASVADLGIAVGAIDVQAALEMSTAEAPADCIAPYDTGSPADLEGDAPDLAAGPPAHLALSANLGLVNDVLYQVWRRGLMCLTDEHLTALGLTLPLDMAAQMLPGLPPGTKMGIEILLKKPLTISGVPDDRASVTLRLEDLEVTLTGAMPDGNERRITITVAGSVTAAIGFDPISNAMMGQLIAVDIEKLELDQLTAAELGFDIDRVKYVLQSLVVPRVVEQMGALPLTGPVFTGAGYAVMLRNLATTDAYLAIKTDLFRAPDGDVEAPDTSVVDFPQKVVSPKDARIQVSGSDAQIPFELLQYVVRVDGIERPATFVRQFGIGEVGASGTYQVEVAAVDLAGNVDPTPATATVTVDGKSPQLLLSGARIRTVEGGTIPLEWTVADDLTPAAQLTSRLEIYEVTDPSDLLAVTMLSSRALPAGATSVSIDDLDADKLYRIEIHAADQVGNDASASVLVDLRAAGGCQTTGGAASGGATLALLGLAIVIGRRRR